MCSGIFGLLILFPLSSFKNIGSQKYTSFAALFFIFLFVVLITYTSFTLPCNVYIYLLLGTIKIFSKKFL